MIDIISFNTTVISIYIYNVPLYTFPNQFLINDQLLSNENIHADTMLLFLTLI
jgi:hypothetical protein